MTEKIIILEITDEIADYLINICRIKLSKSYGYYAIDKSDYFFVREIIEDFKMNYSSQKLNRVREII